MLLVSSYWGLWMGLATAVLSALAFNFFHIPPTGRFTIAEGENWVALVVFLVAAVVTSTLAGAARARADEAERRRREADLSAELARVLLGGASVEDSLATAGQRIAKAFDLPVGRRSSSGWADSDQRRRALPLIVDGQPHRDDAGPGRARRPRCSTRCRTGCCRRSRRWWPRCAGARSSSPR